ANSATGNPPGRAFVLNGSWGKAAPQKRRSRLATYIVAENGRGVKRPADLQSAVGFVPFRCWQSRPRPKKAGVNCSAAPFNSDSIPDAGARTRGHGTRNTLRGVRRAAF